MTLPPADACDTCRRSPADSIRLFTVRSYVVLFRWSRTQQRLCRDCARNAFREAQYECLTRGWWGLLLGPIATLIAIARNLASWRAARRLPQPVGEWWVSPERPVHRRPLAYVTTALAATIAIVAGLVPVIDQHHRATPPVALSFTPASTPTLTDDSVTTDDSTSSDDTTPPAWTGPLSRLAVAFPAGWRREPDERLSASAVSKLFKHHADTREFLDALNYQHGLDRAFYRPAPRVVVEEQLWQFDTSDDADGWMLLWLRANEPHTGSAYRSSFAISGTDAMGYFARTRDQYGFSYGVAVAEVNNVFVHVRYSSLSTVTRANLTAWLGRAVRAAQHGMGNS